MKKFHQFLEEKGFESFSNNVNESILGAVGGALSGFFGSGASATTDADEAENILINQMESSVDKFCRYLTANTATLNFDPQLIQQVKKNIKYNIRLVMDKVGRKKRLDPNDRSIYIKWQ